MEFPERFRAHLASRFICLDVLGQGGAASVFLAKPLLGGDAVAIKCLDIGDDAHAMNLRRRFQREALVLSRLAHPNIVRVLDVSQDEDLPFMILEYVEGATLRAQLGTPNKVAEIVAWAQPVARTLAVCHEADVIHGDIKPENVIMTSLGTGSFAPKVVDFGASKLDGMQRLTRTGTVAGTPMYMAPELFQRDRFQHEREVTAAIDIYALALMMFEARIGQSPFALAHPGKLLAAIARGDKRPWQPVDAVDAAFLELVDRGCAPDPDKRVANATDFAVSIASLAQARDLG